MNQITLEQVRDHFRSELWKLTDNFGEEKHPEKIETLKIIIEIIEKFIPKQPKAEGVSDWYCPTCRAWIKFDSLNIPMESAPKRCEECGQVFEWKEG